MKKIIPIIAIACLFIAVSAFAQRGPGGPPPPPVGAQGAAPGGPGPEAHNVLADYLGLSDSQKASAETIESDFRAAVEPLHEQMHALHEQLDDALEGTDAAKIGNLMLQIGATRDQIDAARKAADAKFIALLTTEQKTKFEGFQAAVEFLRSRGPGGGARP